jgi:Double-GTPase 2
MPNLFSGSPAKRFSLLVMGQRGVGKTVFLAGSYAALQSLSQKERGPLWFDCQTDQAKKNIELILDYVARSGEYPPATMKTLDFDFSLKQRGLIGSQTLCHFGWHDIPGEICTPENESFRDIVLSSHGCCFFVDGYALVHEESYMEGLNELIYQIQIIASLAYLNELNYAFALVITKADLIKSDADGKDGKEKVEQNLQPLFEVLQTGRANYKVFYSAALIDAGTDSLTLKTDGGAAPVLWLIGELFKAYNPGLRGYILGLITRLSQRKQGAQGPEALGSVFQKKSLPKEKNLLS